MNARVETDAIHVLGQLDGARTLADAVDDATAAAGLERDVVVQAALTTIRRLYTRGFVTRVNPP